jgi:hypothetical protein
MLPSHLSNVRPHPAPFQRIVRLLVIHRQVPHLLAATRLVRLAHQADMPLLLKDTPLELDLLLEDQDLLHNKVQVVLVLTEPLLPQQDMEGARRQDK